MTVQLLDVRATNPAQVVSQGQVEADLGVQDRTLVVLSGIALIDWKYNSDVTWHGETEINLGIFASNLEQSSAIVGLASVSNGGSPFVFAADAVSVGLRDSGELFLHIDTALQGNWSYLGRLSYQVVATLVRVSAQISGQISWPSGLFAPSSLDPGLVQAAMTVMANHVEHIAGGSFGYTRLTPLLPGEIYKVDRQGDTMIASYRVDNPPLQVPIQMTVQPRSPFPGNAGTSQSGGPGEFTLTVAAQSIDGVDFTIHVDRIK